MNTDTEIELAIIGNIISGFNPDIDNDIFSILSVNNFLDYKNKIAFEILQEMRAEKKVIDHLTFKSEIQAKGKAEELDDRYIALALENITTPAHTKGYITIIKRNTYLREIRREILKLNPEAEAADLDYIMSLIDLRDNSEKKTVVVPHDILKDYIHDLKTKHCAGIATGFSALDRNLYSQAGDLIVVGARTNVGKTTYLTNILVNMLNKKVPCLYCPTEMRPPQFIDRIAPLVVEIQATKFRSRDFNDSDHLEIATLQSRIGPMPLSMLDIASPTIQEIAMAIKKTECKVLFLDYLGRCSMPREATRMREIERFMVDLKSLCTEQGILCFLAVQLARATDFTKDSAPRLADLSDSSAIEKEADAVIFLWKDLTDYNRIHCCFGKNRHGYLTNFELNFDKQAMRMSESIPGGYQNDHNESAEKAQDLPGL